MDRMSSGSDPDAMASQDSGSVPDVSVIIPAYNGMPYFIRCIESVVAQTLGLDRMEVVVVDDGSSDGTGEEADRWAEKHPGVFRVLHEEGSGGPAKPRNTGLDVATGRYVFFLDADDYWAPRRSAAAADCGGERLRHRPGPDAQ